MPYFVIGKLETALAARGRTLAGAQILLLGLAYKRDIDDPRESPSFKLIELLEQKGAKVVFNDPCIPAFPTMRHYRHLKIKSVVLSEKTLASKDAVLIATDHTAYDYKWIARHAALVIDTRNACRGVLDRARIVRA